MADAARGVQSGLENRINKTLWRAPLLGTCGLYQYQDKSCLRTRNCKRVRRATRIERNQRLWMPTQGPQHAVAKIPDFVPRYTIIGIFQRTVHPTQRVIHAVTSVRGRNLGAVIFLASVPLRLCQVLQMKTGSSGSEKSWNDQVGVHVQLVTEFSVTSRLLQRVDAATITSITVKISSIADDGCDSDIFRYP